MRTYHRYILLKLLGPMLLACFSLTMIAWLTQSLRFIDLIVNRGLSAGTFLYLSSLVLPSLLWVVLPISLFVAITVTFHRLHQDSELTVLRASGLSRYQIIRPVVFFSLGVVMFSYLVGLYLLPTSYRNFKDLQMFIRDNYASTLLQEGVFSSPSDTLTVYIRERDYDGRLNGILVHDTSNPNQHITYMARRGLITRGEEGPIAILEDGNQQTVNLADGSLNFLHFDRYMLTLALFNLTDIGMRTREPEERYIHELFNPTDTREPHLINKFRAEGHFRIIWPLVNLLMMCLALFPHIAGSFRRRGGSRQMTLSACAAGLSLLGVLSMGKSMAGTPEMVAWLYIFTSITLTITFYICGFNHREVMERYYQWKMKRLLASMEQSG